MLKYIIRSKMKRFHKKILIFLAFLVLWGTYLSAEVDTFYSKVFAEGKDYFASGNFKEAIVNFEIAEFGLLDEHEILEEIYLYYSLAMFHIGRINESREIVKRFESELNIKNLSQITIPAQLKIPTRAMLAALEVKNGNSAGKIYRVESLFLHTLGQMQTNELVTVENNIKELERINKKEPRLYYLKGILNYKRKNYKNSLKNLKKFEKNKSPGFETSLLDNLYYHLCLSSHYLGHDTEAALYYNKVKTLDIKSDLYQKIKKKAK